MLGRESIVEDDGQIPGFGKLHPELAERGGGAERPSAAVQIDDHGMRTGALGHRDIGTQAGAQLDVLVKIADRRKIAIENTRQLLPGGALRGNVAGGIPDRQTAENLAVVLADHGCDLAGLRKALAQRAACSNAGAPDVRLTSVLVMRGQLP